MLCRQFYRSDMYEPLATNLVVDDVHSAVFVNGVICQMHEHVRNIVTARLFVLARRKSENATFPVHWNI